MRRASVSGYLRLNKLLTVIGICLTERMIYTTKSNLSTNNMLHIDHILIDQIIQNKIINLAYIELKLILC